MSVRVHCVHAVTEVFYTELEVADRVIQLKDAQGDINTDPRALGTISQYWR